MMADNGIRWYVMRHYDMNYFKECLQIENAQRLDNGNTMIEPFYPSDFLGKHSVKAVADRQKDEEMSALSGDLAGFVFLKGTAADMDLLTDNERNKASYRLRLRHYLDTDGQPATVPDRLMQAFIDACLKYKGQLEITPPISSIEANDKVLITSGPFSGHEASVVQVRHARGSIRLDLAIQLLSGVMSIRMNDVTKSKVTILNRDSNDAIRTDFIEYTQNNLLLILEHRIKRVADESMNRTDADMLTRLYRYRHYEVKNEAARHHFTALMLICAHLCRYTDDEAQLRERVLEALAQINRKSESKAATDARTYLWIALYISTHDLVYRDAAKQYVRDHQPKSPKLRRFVGLIRTGRKV